MPYRENADKRHVTARDVQTLVSLVGRSGATEALACSDVILATQLRELATDVGLRVGRREPKKDIADRIVRRVDQRITKSLEELQTMTKQEISSYLHDVGCDTDEIIELLQQIDLKTQAKRSREALIEFAAVQISSLGVFQRLSDNRRLFPSQDMGPDRS